VDGVSHARRSEAGFTLLELAVATLVLMVAIFIASEMLDQSGRLLQHSVRRAQDPYTLLARELLRNDIRGSSSAHSVVVSGASRPALALDNPGGAVTWIADDRGRLLRAPSGGPTRVYLSNVQSFAFAFYPAPRGMLVEVNVHYHTSGLYLHQAAGSLPRSDPGEDHTLYVAMVARLDAHAW
jgi:hypothetical protein